ncbi:hypothetical protein AB0C93_03755 [Streptomyces sp. NPDC048518]|uniref:hypothetical protein n=1 Tax=Streptomyces sp. NPDC048518 TaxID=3155029 RepID=UPI0033E43CEE
MDTGTEWDVVEARPVPRARYHLRFQLRPGPDLADRARSLAKVCGENGVDEVVLLLGAEQWHTGHLAGAEEAQWFAAAAEARDILAAAGLRVSLNPWVTVGHADRGRIGTLGFAPMVSPTGQRAAAQASFACPVWRRWLFAHYGFFAELSFRVLWVEDDFRFHNHAPLDWGGGFEPLMLQRLASRVGEPVTRDQVVAAVTAPGPPHPWRAQLQQVWRTAQLEVAEGLADVVRERSGGRSRLGLMSSLAARHSVEGRDWAELFGALSIGGEVTHRPHFAPYSDTPARTLASGLWSLQAQRALRPGQVACEPEIENWPHTSWSKSDTQTWSEMVTAQLVGADALLLNLHPTHAERAENFPHIDRLLRRSRPALDWLARECPAARHVSGDAAPLGVGLPWQQDTAARLPAEADGLGDLVVDPARTADFLLGHGVPVTERPAPVQAVFGRQVHAFDDDEIRAFLRGGLLLDGVAAHALTRRGFADLMGARVTELVGRDDPALPGPYAVEQVLGEGGEGGEGGEDHGAYEPDSEGVFLSVDVQPALARVEPLEGAHVLTRIRTPDGRTWGAGRCHFVNALGGRVAILPATAPADLARGDESRRLLHATIRFLEGEQPQLPLVSGAPHLIPYVTRAADGGHRLAVANGSADPARPRVHIPRPPRPPHRSGAVHAVHVRATLLAPLAEPTEVGTTTSEAAAETAATETASVEAAPAVSELNAPLPHRGWAVFAW